MQEYSPYPNHCINFLQPKTNVEKKILWFYKYGKVFYQDNEVGEVMRNYILWCKQK